MTEALYLRPLMSQPDAAPDGPRFRLTLLGPPALIDRAGRPVPGLGPGKPLGMLSYLLFHPALRREQLVALLWGDVPENKARNAFRQTLHRLRSALGDDVLGSEQDQIVLHPGNGIWCDAIAFQNALDKGDVEYAISLYAGYFLQGIELPEPNFSEWVAEQRQRFSAAYEGALSTSAERALTSGDWQLAVQHARAFLRSAPLDADAALLEATALMAGGRRAEAVTALTVHRDRVEQELGSKPTPAVTAMLKALLGSAAAKAAQESARGFGIAESAEPEFVGRETELAQLLAAWRTVTGGNGAAIMLRGEHGVGKSRLIDEFLQRSGAAAASLILRGHERGMTAAVPYASVAEALRGALAAPGIAGASQHLLAEAARLLPELRDQFHLPEPGPLSDDTERIRFFEGIAALIDAVAYEQPVCMILEDMQNASGSTIELVRYLIHRLRAASVLIVATRANGSGDVKPANRASRSARGRRADRIDGFDEIDLLPLSRDESDQMLRALLRLEEISESERGRLADIAEGVPFRLIELAERAKAGEIPSAAPVTIREVLRRRLLQCSPHEQRLFVAAALFAQASSLRLLAAASHISESAALEGAANLEGRGLLVQRRGMLAPASEAAADVALESTGEAGTMLLAGWAADALANENQRAHSELARLYAMAGRKPLAYRHARQAAWDALLAGAYDDAERLLTLAESSATSDSERGELQTVARALGVGSVLLLPGSQPVDRPEITESSPAPADPAATGSDSPNRAADATATKRRWQAWGIRWWIPIAGALALAASVGLRASLEERAATRGNVLVDTLVLSERLGPREVRYYTATGQLPAEAHRARGFPLAVRAPSWLDSLALPWINPRPSPTGELVAVERATGSGVELYILNARSRAATPLATGPGDYIPADWSPDGTRLLAIHGGTKRDRTYDTDLFAYLIADGSQRIAIDTAAGRSVVDARWSPRGTHIAWIAREGATRQQEIFVALADGTQARNLSQHPGEDYDLAWSADGDHIAFTTERDGDAEIYSADILTGRLRRLTFDPAQDSRPSYSPDGQFIAFESTRGGSLQSYVMTALAGAPRRISAGASSLEVAGWRGQAPPFVEELAIRAPSALSPVDTSIVSVEVTDQFGRIMDGGGVTWLSLDPAVAAVRAVAGDADSRAIVAPRRAGAVRIVATAAGWRSDTVVIQIGLGGLASIRDEFETADLSRQWTSLGTPRASVRPNAGRNGSNGLVAGGDPRWESGMLSRNSVVIRPGLTVRSWIAAPFMSATGVPASMNLSLVVADQDQAGEGIPPRFLKLASVTWLGDARRLAYSVGRETRTEPVTAVRNTTEHVIQMVVEPSRRVAFYVDGGFRWRSAIPLAGTEGQRIQLWLGARGSGSRLAFDDVLLSYGEVTSPAPPSR